MKKNVRIILVIAIAMVALLVTGCSSNQASDSTSSVETVNKYDGWEIIAITASAYNGSLGTGSCIVVTAIDADNYVHTLDLNSGRIVIVETGSPYLDYDANYGARLYVTKADLATYLN